ncbi:MAG: aminoglycoside phosphotransferase family protein, partial [Kiritimatiellae bacterium]|nr:aminoglycoside phosphotransferase family protein [Kiritimatiellia bacterium]
MTQEQKDILLKAGIGDATDVSRYGSGHINETYKVETASGTRYILQRVNTSIFDERLLKANVMRVTEFLKAKGVKSLEVVAYESPWRVYKFLEGYESHDVVEEPHQAYDVGRAFAKFQNDLADIPPPRLDDIIPKFHDTPDRLRQLDEAIARDVKGRLAGVGPELAFVDTWRERAGRIVGLMASGDIPERVTHNDTKINNVMIDARGEVRRVEFFSTLTALLTLSGGFLLVGIVLDHIFRDGLPVRWRWIYALSAAAVLLAYFLKRLIVSATHRVNPLYAADVLEKNLPEVKNGLIIWLTLRNRPARGGVERAVRHALASQTADHLAVLPGESVGVHAPVIRWAAALAVVAALVSLYFVSAPKSPFVSAARILLPSLDWAAPQAIEFLEIEPGNGSVYYRTPVAFRARVAGGTPGDVRLIWSSADRRLVDQVVPMQSVGGQLYELTFPPEGTGMTESILYRIAAGAGRYESFSETFRLEVRPPLTFDVEKLELTPPPYTGAGTVTQEANGTIRALPETEVTITGRASEPLSKAFWVPDFSTSR